MFYVKKVIFLGLGNTHPHTHSTDTHADTLIHSLCPQTCSLSAGSHDYFWPSALDFCFESAVLSCFAWFLRHCSWGGGECSVPGCVDSWWGLERNLPQGEQAASSLLSLETWGFWIGWLLCSSGGLSIPSGFLAALKNSWSRAGDHAQPVFPALHPSPQCPFSSPLTP